jgi:hypothetical protein
VPHHIANLGNLAVVLENNFDEKNFHLAENLNEGYLNLVNL